MGLTTADSYYLKAKAACGGFASDWGEVSEALNYALSYDENHEASLCLLGEIYAKNLVLYDQAFECFDKLIAANMNYVAVYPKYVLYLIWAHEYERAKQLIEFAMTVEGVDTSQLLWMSSYIEETQGNYKQSLKFLKEAKKKIYNDYYFGFMDDEADRIKKKIKLDKPKKKKSKKKKSKKKNKKKKK